MGFYGVANHALIHSYSRRFDYFWCPRAGAGPIRGYADRSFSAIRESADTGDSGAFRAFEEMFACRNWTCCFGPSVAVTDHPGLFR
jgi:hypothetical protein